MKYWIDISQPLSASLAQFPGDTPFQYRLANSKERDGTANIGDITMCLHNGTHVDAPFHYDTFGKTIETLPPEIFIGKAMVIDVSNSNNIDSSALSKHRLEGVNRVLLRTSLKNDTYRFPLSFPSLDPDIAPYLKEKGIQLIGVDLPSVDPIDSRDLPTHHALNSHDIYILENIMLDHVEPGLYEMVALPLHIKGADASPVRAVIRSID